jgi:hypothetical protein
VGFSNTDWKKTAIPDRKAKKSAASEQSLRQRPGAAPCQAYSHFCLNESET